MVGRAQRYSAFGRGTTDTSPLMSWSLSGPHYFTSLLKPLSSMLMREKHVRLDTHQGGWSLSTWWPFHRFRQKL
jgi:hypothetical protein